MNHQDPFFDAQLSALSGKAEKDIETLEIPETLLPENIEKKLREDARTQKHTQTKKNRKNLITIGSAAACLALITGLVVATSPIYMGTKENSKSSSGNTFAPTELVSLKNDGSINAAFRPASSEDEFTSAFRIPNIITDDLDYESAESSVDKNYGVDGVGNETSSTNTQVAGIDEGDYVKVDNGYIYMISYNVVVIVKNENGHMQKVASIKNKEDNLWPREIYLDTQKEVLIVIYSDRKTYVSCYDVSDPTAPELLDEFNQSGAYNSSRYVDGFLYLFSQETPYMAWHHYPGNFYDYRNNRDEEKIDGSIPLPCVNDTPLSYEDIYVPVDGYADTDFLMTSIDLSSNSLSAYSTAAFCLPYSTVYMGHESIYLMSNAYIDYVYTTQLTKIGYDQGSFYAIASGYVPGYVPDTFAISENGDHFYMLVIESTGVTSENNLYVLDKRLKISGSIKDIAPEETIYAARYINDMAYFITYKNVDPLFVADLSQPDDPKLLGSVEISGYSEYLHPFGENLLLGIGYETTPTGEGDWVRNDGAKIVMFDVSDPLHPVILDSVKIENAWGSEASYDYKAVLTNINNGLIGIPVYSMNDYSQYLCYRWDGKQFTEEMRDTPDKRLNTGYASSTYRGSYIGQYLFVSIDYGIVSYDMENGFDYVDSINFEIPESRDNYYIDIDDIDYVIE